MDRSPADLAHRLSIVSNRSPHELLDRHCAGARLFANRYSLIAQLRVPAGPVVTEVGVGLGDFSAFLIEQLRPARFHAIDIFRMHEIDDFWGVPRAQVFGERTHEQFYRDRFAALGDRMVILEGDSLLGLGRLADGSQDLIYIDANHAYESVREEAALAARKLKPDGVIVFNDYITYDPFLGIPYGVVRAVNEMVVAGGWHVVGFALNHAMFCDIAIRRRPLGRVDRLLRRLV
jgi:hypothetical protein